MLHRDGGRDRQAAGSTLGMAAALAAATALVAAAAAGAGPVLDASQLLALRARFVGPAEVGGRLTAVEAVAAHPEVIYVGSAGGGVWKSTDAGATWQPIFDSQPVASIGALAIFQARPDIVWVGTGEANFHVTAGAGDGVYRSTDGGRSWTHLGLAASAHIARIVLHPSNPDIAWVAAAGPIWREGGERGVYKTVDGGRSWARVLFVDDQTGAGDVALDPGNPDRLLANLWQVRRWPWELRSGGPGSGLYLSEDGGGRWARLTAAQGLPAPPEAGFGRMKLAFSPSQPAIAYAMVEIERAGVLLRSTDGGQTWSERFRHPNLFPRPFFFGEMKVDPRRPDRLYSLHTVLDVSQDGGKSWDYRLASGVHPDQHALWIDPGDSDHMLIGTDGGLYVSRDGGRSAAWMHGPPLTQWNRVAIDLDVPYHVYGGTQDNGSWRGPAASWEAGGIYQHGWVMLGGSDGTTALPDPTAPGQGYDIAQNGQLERWDLATGEWRDLRPRLPAAAVQTPLRFGWVTPFALDPFAPSTLYCGSQFVLRSDDRGNSWSAISPDLTTNNPSWQRQDESGGLTPDVGGAETYTTVSALAPSPLARGLIWAGTDDGRLYLTADGGATWSSVEERLPGAPAHAWVTRILASRAAAGTAFVLLDDHRRGEDWTYLYRTDDRGASWRRLPTAGVRGYARAIAQDAVDPSLLFLGTEAGLWLSRDGGSSWLQWPAGPAATGALPPAPVADLAVHPRDYDLVIATHGRGVFIVDDISPLRHLDAATLTAPLRLLPVGDAQQHVVRNQQVGGPPLPRGEERAYGALLTLWVGPAVASGSSGSPRSSAPRARAADGADSHSALLPDAQAGAGLAAVIQISERDGRAVRTFTALLHAGLNRIIWGLQHDSWTRPPRDSGRGPLPAMAGPGPEVPPGTYEIAVRAAGHEAHGTVRVLADPRSTNTAADWQLRWAALRRVEELRQAVVEAIERLRRARADLADLAAAAAAGAAANGTAVRTAPLPEIAELRQDLDRLEAGLIAPRKSPIGVARHDLTRRLFDLEDALDGSMVPPTAAQAADLDDAAVAVTAALAAIDRFAAGRLAPLYDRAARPRRRRLRPHGSRKRLPKPSAPEPKPNTG
jgi:photosystem II stability/assembly factor-like uncharacterized protein